MVEVDYIRAQVTGPNCITLPLAKAQGNARSGKHLAREGSVVCDVTPSFPLRDQKLFDKPLKALFVSDKPGTAGFSIPLLHTA